MAYIHHGTIRKYTAALLSFFNGIEVQHVKSTNSTVSKNVPVQYATREKSKIFDEHTTEQLLEGNYNVLPRANLSLITAVKYDARIQNKNLKINPVSSADSMEYQYNSVPYEFTFEYAVKCRGMNEASQIIEQIAPKFNPTVNIDIWDGANLSEPTRVPVRLLDIGIESEEYEEVSSNIITISFGISIMGNLYSPVRSIEKVKNFKIFMNEMQNDDYFSHADILGWDVSDAGKPVNEVVTVVDDVRNFPPVIIDIVANNLVVGDNEIVVIYTDADNRISELNFDWDVILGDATVSGNHDKSTVTINSVGNIEIQVIITDVHGNSASLNKTFTVI